MIARHAYKGGVWIDIEQPTAEEVRTVAEEFGINERLETELVMPTPTPLVAGDAHMALLVLHFPSRPDENGGLKDQELDFIVGGNFIITVRYEIIVSLHHLKKLLETEEFTGGTSLLTTDVMLETLFAHLYTALRDQAGHSSTRMAQVEKEVFSGHERLAVRSISAVSRQFLHLESALANQAEPLSRFLHALGRYNFFGASFPERVERILAEHAQVTRLVETQRAVATELRETNNSLLETRQNEIIKTLTVLTVISLPLELIALIMAMEVPGLPLQDEPNGFLILMAVMLAIAGCLTIYFARKRWIF